MPGAPELGLDAVGEGGVRVINDTVVRLAEVNEQELAGIERREHAEVDRRAHLFRGDLPPVPLAGRTVIVVDDGIATGSTARAACQVVRARGAARVVLAVPVAPEGIEDRMRPDVDEVVCLSTPGDFFAIGQFYADFSQVDDSQVVRLLRRALPAAACPGRRTGHGRPARSRPGGRRPGWPGPGRRLPDRPGWCAGHRGVRDGSGSSRHSPRNRYVAAQLNVARFATLLFDLLSVEEEADRANVFDIGLLADRLLEVTAWLRTQPDIGDLPVGYFGASTGAGAALRRLTRHRSPKPWSAAEADPTSPVRGSDWSERRRC